MTYDRAMELIESLSPEERDVVFKLVALLANEGRSAKSPTSWYGILKDEGTAPSMNDFREAREECWNFDGEDNQA